MDFLSRDSNRSEAEFSGMTILELLLATTMLVVFTGVVVMVMQFTFRFFKSAEPKSQAKLLGSGGVLVDHGQLHIAMDALVEVLSQPGVSLNNIAFSQSFKPNSTLCTETPVTTWSMSQLLDENEIHDLIPPGYHLCLYETTEKETPTSPGIYLLQALPDQVRPSSLPTRRLFCRPRPLC